MPTNENEELTLGNTENQQIKLTDWENEPTVETLEADFRTAKPYHDAQIAKIHHWRDVLNVTGSAAIPKVPNRSSVQPKMAKKQATWRYSALEEPFLNNLDIFSVSPRTFEDREAAKQNEMLLNYQFDTKIDKVTFMDKLVHRVVDDGTAIIRIGWDREEKTVLVPTPVFDYFDAMQVMDEQQLQMYMQQLQQLMQLQAQSPRDYEQKTSPELKEALRIFMETEQLVQVTISGYEQIPSTQIVRNCPTLNVMRPENVYIDPGSEGNQEDLDFIIYTFQASKAYLMKSGLYTNLESINWDNAIVDQNSYEFTTDTPSEYNDTIGDKIRRKAVVKEWWGFFDIHETGELVPIVASWIGNTMIRLAENPFPDQKLPFVFIPYLPVSDSIYGEPDTELLEDPQRISGAVYRGIIDLLGKSANSQQGFAKGMLDSVNKKKFMEGSDYEFNPERNIQGSGYIMHTFPEIPVSSLNFLQMQNYEAESLTGIKAFSGGISGDAYGRVVAAANYAHDAAANLEMNILRRIAKGMSTIGSKIIAMNTQFLTDAEIIRITNRPNANATDFLAIHPEDIQGNFDCIVDIKTAKAIEDQVTKLTMLMQTVGPNCDFGILKIAMSELADLMKMPDMAEAIRQYEPQPDPALEQQKQLLNQKLQSEIELNGAKVQDLAASAQRTVLETQEEVSGINHQRKMEQVAAQADSQEVQTIIKGIMQPQKADTKAPNVDAALGLHLAKDKLKQASDENFARNELVKNAMEEKLINEYMQ